MDQLGSLSLGITLWIMPGSYFVVLDNVVSCTIFRKHAICLAKQKAVDNVLSVEVHPGLCGTMYKDTNSADARVCKVLSLKNIFPEHYILLALIENRSIMYPYVPSALIYPQLKNRQLQCWYITYYYMPE